MKSGFQSYDYTSGSDFGMEYSENSSNSLDIKKENIKYKKENQTLQSQFDDMNRINEQITQMQKDNVKIAKESSSIRLENEDLKQKQVILYEQISSLKKQLSEAKQAKQKPLFAELSEMQNKITKEKAENAKKLEKLSGSVNSLQEKLDNAYAESSDIKSKIQLLLSVAESYFGSNFQSVDYLIAFLNEGKESGKAAEASEKMSEKYEESIKAKKKEIRELKKIAKEEHNAKKEAISENRELKLALEKQKTEYEAMLKEASKKQSELEYSAKLLEHQMKVDKETQEAQMKILKDQLSNQKQKLLERPNDAQRENDKNKIATLQKQLANAINKANSMRASVIELNKQLNELKSQVKIINDEKNRAQSSLEIAKNENKELKDKYDETKKEMQQLKVSNALLEENVKSVSLQVQAAKATFAQSQYAFHEEETTIENQKNAIKRLEKLIAEQKEEIKELFDSKTKSINIITKQNNLIRALESFAKNQQSEFNEQISELSNELREEKKNSAEYQNRENDEIPVTSWFCADFPKELCSRISDIATNNAIKTTTKLKSVLSTIAKFYNTKFSTLEKNSENEKEQINKNMNVLSQFIEEISKIIKYEQLSADTLIEDPSSVYSTSNDIQNIFNGLNEKAEFLDEYGSDISEIMSNLRASNLHEAVDKLNSLLNDLKLACSKVEKMKNKFSNANKAKKQKEEEIDAIKSNQTKELQKIQEHIQNLSKENSDYAEENHQLQSEIIKLKSKIDELSQGNENAMSAKEFELNSMLEKERAKGAEELAKEIEAGEELKSKLDDAYSVIDNMKEEKKELNKIIDSIQKDNDKKESMIVELTLEHEASKDNSNAEHSKEKNEMNEHFNSVFNSMKGKNEEQRSIIDKLTNAVNDCETRYKELFEINNQLESRNRSVEDSLQLAQSELEREKKLRASQMKAVILTTEMKAQTFIDDEKAKNEKKMKKLYSFIATQFKQYFDITKPLDGENIKDVIFSVHSELETLNDQMSGIRRLLGIDETESPVDALSKLLISVFITN